MLDTDFGDSEKTYTQGLTNPAGHLSRVLQCILLPVKKSATEVTLCMFGLARITSEFSG